MIRFLTSGESHGKGLNVIIEGFPSNLKFSEKFINTQLKRRQSGYGRGARMKIESDKVEILSGVRYGKTLGSPITFYIQNKDWENWKDIMALEENSSKSKKIYIPRPGHADLVGSIKYNFDDIRNSIERASARETAARVAAGAAAKIFLKEFGIEIGSFVESIGGVYGENILINNLFSNKLKKNFSISALNTLADKSEVRVIEQKLENKIINKIKLAKKKGDTLGGTFYVIATGVPIGLGSFMHYDRKLDAKISNVFMSINAVKGVEIGKGFSLADKFGSEVHDEIIFSRNLISRKTNYAGGIEGGISNGMPIIIRASMKPIATLMKPLKTIDLKTFKAVTARRERSDFVAVPACSIIGEAMLAWVLAEEMILKFGGDSIEEIKANFNLYSNQLNKRIKKNFRGN